MDSSKSNEDEYFVSTPQVFEGCGGDNSRGSATDKFLHLKNNRYNGDRSLQLHDSDSGISNDGYHILEELHSELKEKEHTANKLKSTLEFFDRQHEEAMSAVLAERDSLKLHLNMLRSENQSLANLKCDYEECCDRLCAVESALKQTQLELEGLRRKNKEQDLIINEMENEKITLQELLNQSKGECHRINEMYASRQSNLLVQNESLKAQCAELNSRIQDQDDILQHLITEKVKAEMELKEAVNRSNFNRLNNSIDVSYTEDQMLTALDSLNAESRFCQGQSLDEDPFNLDVKNDARRLTNVSLFDEIRQSFDNSSHFQIMNDCSKFNAETVGTQTDSLEENRVIDNNNHDPSCKDCKSCIECEKKCIEILRLEKALADVQCDLKKYEENVRFLEALNEDDKIQKRSLLTEVESLNAKICDLEHSFNKSSRPFFKSKKSASAQTNIDVANVSTQAETSCSECEKRELSQTAEPAGKRSSWSRYLWNGLRSLFSVLSCICFIGAVLFLYNVSTYHYEARRCSGAASAVPWRWLTVHDLIDVVFRVQYVGEVPR